MLRIFQGVPEAGGYLTAADDVVQAFHLPKFQHVVAAYSSDPPPSESGRDKHTDATQDMIETNAKPIFLEQEDDAEMDVPQLQPRSETGTPITMRELADAARQRSSNDSTEDYDHLPSLPSTNHGLIAAGTRSGISARSTKGAQLARTISKPKNNARKRPRDESDRPVLDMPTRVLRPRASKSVAQLQEEREREHAYRRAIAE